MRLKKILFFLLFFCLGAQLFAQHKTVKDSTEIYKEIEVYSQKSRFTKLLHDWIFRPTKRENKPSIKVKPNYNRYDGKIVRKIIINSKDPFGFSVTDTTRTPETWLEKTGNIIHIKSKEMAIRNFLLLKENKPLDTFLIAESARLLRKQSFISEVKILPKLIPNSKDSVDVIVTTLDSWSLIPKGSFSSSEVSLGVRERNIMGTGHELNLDYSNRHDDGKNSFDGSYTIPNFKNTFITSTIQYKTEYDSYFDKNITVDRTFHSPITRWAGGIFLQERFLERLFPDDSLVVINQNIRFFAQDYWGGHSFKLLKGDSEAERSTNLVVSARALIVNYKEKPPIEYDSINFFSDEKLYLASTGLTSRRYVEDSYIFRDGATEDVPVGLVYSITGGVQNKNHINSMYLGARIFYGNYFKWGFLSTNCEVGTFFNGSITEQTAYSINISYFSNLLYLGGEWKMRQFIKPQFLIGINRLNSVGDRLSLNDDRSFSGIYNISDLNENGSIEGFNGIAVGTKKYILALQSQFYSPWELLGFRFNPFINITAGMLKGEENSFGTNKLYSSIGVGFVIRNDYLVFDSFQISLTYYPQIPGEGNNIFKANSFTNDDFGFQDFEMGKPHPVLYR